MPFVRRLAIHYPHGLIHTIVTCATPMTDRTSMILQWVYRNDTEEQVNSADVVAFDRAITLEDKRILESCDADVPLADTDGEEMHMRTDYPGVVMRRMFAKLLAITASQSSAPTPDRRKPSAWRAGQARAQSSAGGNLRPRRCS